MLIVIPTGTRHPSDFDEQVFIDWFIGAVKSRIRKDGNGVPIDEPVLMIEGGANGVDSVCQTLADRDPFTDAMTVHSLWDLHGKRAGMRRNALMLRTAQALASAIPNARVVVLGCPGPTSKGTWGMLDLARKRGVDLDFLDAWADPKRVAKFRESLRN